MITLLLNFLFGVFCTGGPLWANICLKFGWLFGRFEDTKNFLLRLNGLYKNRENSRFGIGKSANVNFVYVSSTLEL